MRQAECQNPAVDTAMIQTADSPQRENENVDTYEGSEKGRKNRETLMAAVLWTALWKAGKDF